MRSYIKKLGLAAVAVLAIAATPVATSSTADARPGFHRGFHHHGFHGFRHHGFRGHWGHRRLGFGFAPAIALGAFAAAPYWYSRPVGLYADCFPRRRIVGYTYWGRPIVRVRTVCY
jgi:hypothetical protein